MNIETICDAELVRVGLAVEGVKIGDRVVVKDSGGEWSGVIEDHLGGNQWWIKGDARDAAIRVDGSKIVRKLSAKVSSTSLSSLCDRELARVGLAHPGGDVDDDELIAAIIKDGWDRGSAAEVIKKWRAGKDVGQEADQAIYRAAKRITGKGGASLSSLCDRELARVGLGMSGLSIGTWVVHPVRKIRGVVDHVYDDNVNEKGALVQVDYGKTKANHREKDLTKSKDQDSNWVDNRRELSRLSSLCDRELARVGLASGSLRDVKSGDQLTNKDGQTAPVVSSQYPWFKVHLGLGTENWHAHDIKSWKSKE